MSHFPFARGRALWMVCVCLLVVPGLAAAAEAAPDFDGDGQSDHVEFDRRIPSLVRVWLSASNTTLVVHSRVPLQGVVAIDIDGDRRSELVARDTESRLHVWTQRRARFHSYRPRRHVPAALQEPGHRSVQDHGSDPDGVVSGTTFIPLAPTSGGSAYAPDRPVYKSGPPSTATVYRSLTAIDPFAPRPPPALLAF